MGSVREVGPILTDFQWLVQYILWLWSFSDLYWCCSSDTCRCSTRSESFRSDVLILCMYCSYSREIMDSVSEVLIYSPSSLFRVEILSHLGAPITLSVAKAMTIITLDVQYMVRNNWSAWISRFEWGLHILLHVWFNFSHSWPKVPTITYWRTIWAIDRRFLVRVVYSISICSQKDLYLFCGDHTYCKIYLQHTYLIILPVQSVSKTSALSLNSPFFILYTQEVGCLKRLTHSL